MKKTEYQFVNLDEEDLQRVHAMEQDLTRKYDREIVLIAYERRKQPAASSAVDGATEGLGDPRRGTTFGYTNPQFDGYPTLADVQTKYDGSPDGLRRSVAEEAAGESPGPLID